MDRRKQSRRELLDRMTGAILDVQAFDQMAEGRESGAGECRRKSLCYRQTQALEYRIYRCLWDSVVLDGGLQSVQAASACLLSTMLVSRTNSFKAFSFASLVACGFFSIANKFAAWTSMFVADSTKRFVASMEQDLEVRSEGGSSRWRCHDEAWPVPIGSEV